MTGLTRAFDVRTAEERDYFKRTRFTYSALSEMLRNGS
jgi:hypothetical protein